MADLGTLVREQMNRAGAPAYTLHDLDRRQGRKRRNQRITAGLIGLVVFVMFASAVVGAIQAERGRQAGDVRPSRTLGEVPRSEASAGERLPSGQQQRLEPGRHFVSAGERAVWFDVPRGWLGWWLGIVDPVAKGLPPDGTGFGIWEVEQIYADPCRWDQGTIATGSSVDDLVAALAQQPMRSATTPRDAEIDGFSGKVLQIHVPSDLEFDRCSDGNYGSGEFRSWPGRFHQGPGQIDRIWVLDVDGERVVVDAFWFPQTTAAQRAELFEIIESIRIRPLAG